MKPKQICQSCRKVLAQYHYVETASGSYREYHLCSECVKGYSFPGSVLTERAQPPKGERLRKVLSRRLVSAVSGERYEEAAKLRDRISDLSKE